MSESKIRLVIYTTWVFFLFVLQIISDSFKKQIRVFEERVDGDLSEWIIGGWKLKTKENLFHCSETC